MRKLVALALALLAGIAFNVANSSYLTASQDSKTKFEGVYVECVFTLSVYVTSAPIKGDINPLVPTFLFAENVCTASNYSVPTQSSTNKVCSFKKWDLSVFDSALGIRAKFKVFWIQKMVHVFGSCTRLLARALHFSPRGGALGDAIHFKPTPDKVLYVAYNDLSTTQLPNNLLATPAGANTNSSVHSKLATLNCALYVASGAQLATSNGASASESDLVQRKLYFSGTTSCSKLATIPTFHLSPHGSAPWVVVHLVHPIQLVTSDGASSSSRNETVYFYAPWPVHGGSCCTFLSNETRVSFLCELTYVSNPHGPAPLGVVFLEHPILLATSVGASQVPHISNPHGPAPSGVVVFLEHPIQLVTPAGASQDPHTFDPHGPAPFGVVVFLEHPILLVTPAGALLSYPVEPASPRDLSFLVTPAVQLVTPAGALQLHYRMPIELATLNCAF